jgi:hypothetical protein
MGTPDDHARGAADIPECPTCGADLPKLGPNYYGMCTLCPEEQPGDRCTWCGKLGHCERACPL